MSGNGLIRAIRLLFGFSGYTEMFSRLDKESGLRESGIIIQRIEKKDPDRDDFRVSINWKILSDFMGDDNED